MQFLNKVILIIFCSLIVKSVDSEQNCWYSFKNIITVPRLNPYSKVSHSQLQVLKKTTNQSVNYTFFFDFGILGNNIRLEVLRQRLTLTNVDWNQNQIDLQSCSKSENPYLVNENLYLSIDS